MKNVVFFHRCDEADLSGAAHRLLESVLGFPPVLTYNTHGKPFLAGDAMPWFSLSHTRGAVVCALSAHPVGVDVESLHRQVNLRLAARFFTPAEQAQGSDSIRFLEIWTRKEALMKRDGNGMSIPLEQLETVGHPQLVTREVDGFVLSFCGDPAAFDLCIK